jgi:twinkle protein
MISEATIQAINHRVEIQSVVGDYIKLKKQGTNYVGLCPFHNEKTASFTVSPSKGIYKCFGCGRSGDTLQFLMEHEKKSYPEAIDILAKKYNVEIEHEGKRKEYVKPTERLEKLSKKHLEWFETERKISNDTLLRMNITEAREYMPQLKGEVNTVCFNYFRGDNLVNIKFRGPQKSFKLSKDAELIFYNLNALEKESIGIIVEGEMDVLTMVECGIYNAVGVPNGTPPKGSKMNLEYLDNCYTEFAHLKTVIIAVDDDEVGRHLKEELGRRIGKQKCKIVTYPEGCKDSNDVLVKHGKAAVVEMINAAKDWPLEGIIPMDDIADEIIEFYEKGYPLGDKAGIEGFDPLLSFMGGQLTMVTGIPGHGKDEFTNWIMASLSKNHGWKWGVFNFEEPAEIHTTKLMEKFTDKAFAFRKEQGHRMSRMEFDRALSKVDEHFHFVNVSKIDVTMDGVIAKAAELVNRYGINGMIINPWNYLEHKRSGYQTETEYISEALTKLINFLWQYGVHCLLIAHPYKMQKDKKTGEYEVPTLYSISGSSHFYNKTHNGFCVYRNRREGTVDVHVQKVKWYWLGKTDVARFHFNVNTRTYSPAEPQLPEELPDLPQGNWKPVPKDFTEPIKKDETEDLPF